MERLSGLLKVSDKVGGRVESISRRLGLMKLIQVTLLAFYYSYLGLFWIIEILNYRKGEPQEMMRPRLKPLIKQRRTCYVE